jgi:hypothetical protein
VKLRNTTRYRTDTLRRFLRAGIVANGLDPKGYGIRVIPARGRRHCGLAYLDASWVRLSIPTGALDVGVLARVFEHELAHNRGVRHEDMDPDTLACRGPCPDWAVSFTPADFEVAEPPKVPRAERMTALVLKREEHARRMLEAWERKAKRAVKSAAKWRGVVRGYERRAAARKAAPLPAEAR